MRVRRVAVAGSLAALLLVLVGPARAHVTVTPEQAERGSTVDLSFRVPNEKAAASTVRVEIAFPVDHAIPAATPRLVPGWTASVDMGTGGRVARVVWEGGAISGDERAEFVVTVGPLPGAADRLVFKALQHYDDGEVVAWIEEPVTGGPEPQHPAPVVRLTGPPPTTTTSSTTAPTSTSTSSFVPVAEGGRDGGDAMWWVIGGAGAVAIAVLAVVLLRRRLQQA
jgi:periplasmic copper chaperone A